MDRYRAKRLAQALQVTECAVYSWVRGESVPTPRRLYEMVELSRGRISIRDVTGHQAEVRGKKMG